MAGGSLIRLEPSSTHQTYSRFQGSRRQPMHNSRNGTLIFNSPLQQHHPTAAPLMHEFLCLSAHSALPVPLPFKLL